ncbi:MAG: hypothetical protein KAR84_08445 [Elusimicrobiales bacterium]|nr:hypothetical protein [Elusimicrobiales bacterium]MCK5106040.1 hypothetical protein [Elusimicrobiales bacterium]MCK5357754.1 hypothetical protein [Elusimicrobiales bacterium]
MLEEEIKKYHKLASIISYAVIGIVIIYAITIEIFRNATGFKPLLEPQAAMIAKVASFFIAVSVFTVIKQISKTKLKPENNKIPENFLQNMFFVDMIKAAIFEVPAFMGFILFFLAGAYAEFYILSAFSIVLVISNFPKAANWTKELRRRFP